MAKKSRFVNYSLRTHDPVVARQIWGKNNYAANPQFIYEIRPDTTANYARNCRERSDEQSQQQEHKTNRPTVLKRGHRWIDECKGPYFAQLICSRYNRHLRWLPKPTRYDTAFTQLNNVGGR